MLQSIKIWMYHLLRKTIISLGLFAVLVTGLALASTPAPGESVTAGPGVVASMGTVLDSPSFPQPAPPRKKYAVVIGIVYQSADFGIIKHTDDDAAAVDTLLTQKWGYPRENVLTLLNEQATGENIINALRWLATNPDIDENTDVVFYYSGHGIRNGAGINAPPSFDQGAALVPYDYANFDFRTGNGLVWDGELAQYLGQVKAGRMWINFDSCFSGTFTAPGIAGPNRVVTMSSLPNELSSEIDHVQRGVLTQLLVEEGVARGLSIEDAYLAATPRAVTEFHQTPQIADGYPGNLDLAAD